MVTDSPPPSFKRYAAGPVPQTAVGAPGKGGTLELTFERTSRGTALVHDYAAMSPHISGTFGHDPHLEAETVSVQSPTGGVAQGDHHDLTIAVEADAVAHVSTQSSTKVQTMERDYANIDATLSVAAGGHLDYVPEPTILHADARYTQDLRLDVADGAMAIVDDVVISGWLARGRRFEFDRYHSRLRTTGPDGLLFEGATHLVPDESDLNAPGLLDKRAIYGILFIVAPGRDAVSLSDDLHGAVAATDACAGATELPNDAGVAVCVLSDCADTARTTCDAAWNHVRRTLLDASTPSERKCRCSSPTSTSAIGTTRRSEVDWARPTPPTWCCPTTTDGAHASEPRLKAAEISTSSSDANSTTTTCSKRRLTTLSWSNSRLSAYSSST